MTIDNVLEILEKHKLHIPSNVFYELKADIVNFEEPTTKNDLVADYTINGLDDFIEFGKKAFGVELTIKKSDNPDTYEKLFGTTKNDLGVDCIDRNSIKYYSGTGGYMYASKGEIDKLPLVTPQEPILDKIKKDFIDKYPKNYANELELGGKSCIFSLNDILHTIDKYKIERKET